MLMPSCDFLVGVYVYVKCSLNTKKNYAKLNCVYKLSISRPCLKMLLLCSISNKTDAGKGQS